MTNSLSKFYSDQAGSGIDIFSGYHRNMKGDGYFGRFYSTTVKPMLSSFIPVLKNTAVEGASKAVEHLSNKIRAIKRKSEPKATRPVKKRPKKQTAKLPKIKSQRKKQKKTRYNF